MRKRHQSAPRSDAAAASRGRLRQVVRGLGGAVLALGVVATAAPVMTGLAPATPVAAATTAPPRHAPLHAALPRPAFTHHGGLPGPKLPATPPMASLSSVHATFVVDTAADPTTGTSCLPGHPAGTCSLRAAVAAADADTGYIDAITIPAGMVVTLTQQSTLDLTNSMFINGTGATVNGEGAEVFDQYNDPSVQITGLTITNGVSSGEGGGMDCSDGALVLARVTFTGNSAARGGGLYTHSHCQLWVDDSVFTKNEATGDSAFAYGDGGGLYTYGSAFITNTTFGGATAAAGNMAEDGAGLYNYDGNVVLIDSVVSHNSSPDSYGYGVGLYNDELMDVVNTSIDHNMAPYGADGAGMDVEYLTTITDSSFTANVAAGDSTTYGGVLYDDGDTTTLQGVSFRSNKVQPTGGEDVYGGAVLSYAYNFSWDGGSITGQSNGLKGESDYIEGGAIYLDGSHASIRNVKISGTTNQSLPDEYPEGGAIYVNEYSELTDVAIANTSNYGNDVYGGAIYNDDYATLTGLTVTNTLNHATDSSGGYIAGGLIYNDGENFAVSGLVADKTTNIADTGSTTPSDYSSEIDGGLVYNDYESTIDGFTATNTTSTASGGVGEIYGGAFYNDESLILRDSQFLGTTVKADSYVEGGLFYNDDRLSARNFTMGNSTVSVLGGTMAGHPYADGSILYNDSQANLVNTTFDNIKASVPTSGDNNWGIENDDLLQVVNSTFGKDGLSGPAGGTWLVYGYGDSQMSLRNSIVASSAPKSNCSGSILSAGYNIDNGSSCGFTRTGDMENTNPLLQPLHDNGGPVMTAALTPSINHRAASPAIDAGSNIGCPATDARGVVRPQGKRCDIGAYEVEAEGYWITTANGKLLHYGAGSSYGSVAQRRAAGKLGFLQGPIGPVAAAPDHKGYWQAGADGGVFAFGSAVFRGSLAQQPMAGTIVAAASTPDGMGYFLVSSTGHVYVFGDARYFGSEPYRILKDPAVGIAVTRDGGGYLLATASGRVLAFGDARSHGSPVASHMKLAAPVVGITSTEDGLGYWLATANGRVFDYGDAKWYGSMATKPLASPIVAIVATPDSFGYWLFGAKGRVFHFGDAKFLGAPSRLATVVTGAASAN